MIIRRPVSALLLVASLFLAACESPEKRAEAYFQSGMQYLQAGDVDRALVEFRNVFKFNGKHRAARLAYADAERKRGNLKEAYSQYLRLVEQYPDDMTGLRALSEMAVDNAQWDDASRFISAALALKPDDQGFQALKIFRDYGEAVERSNTAGVVAAVKAAQEMKARDPGNLVVRKVIIDDLIRSQNLQSALTELDGAIAIAPDERLLYAQRLSVRAALNDDAGVEAGLLEMTAKFPDAPEIQESLTRWYIARKEYDKAEAHLRSLVDPKSDDPGAEIALVRFLGQYRGADAAIAELDKAIASGKAPAVFRSSRAGFLFDRGDRTAAIAEMEAILNDLPKGAEERTIKIGLARMKTAVGDNVAARALVEQVLSEDSGQVEAIKMKATWLIMGDQAGDAIALLRDSLDDNPRNPDLITLLAQAYDRQGEHDLMRDMLAQAVEASGRAPAESLRYAQLLASENKLLPAEGVLLDALRLSPGDPSLLVPLGQLYVAMKDWPRADAVAQQLESLKDDTVSGDLADLRAAILEGQQNNGAALSYLEQMATGQGAGLDAKIALVRNHLANGRNAEALAFAQKMLADQPDNLDVQFIAASVEASVGERAAAEAGFRKILTKDPARPAVWMSLYRLVMTDPARRADGDEVLKEGLAAAPQAGELKWAEAGQLESEGNIDGAITIYEALYKDNSANPIIANNLASLLSNYRKDPDSLQRAAVIARRLKGSGYAPYQDTYGWIAALTGNLSDAVGELEKAAAGLPDDPTVHYHLAMAYLRAGRQADAAKAFERVVALIPANDSRDFAISAKKELEKLKSAGIAE
ncbi:MAG: tetratricopeptide repeat protein [Proteobacteria bacterium]|nr:tetratricopeptide repeat protein [Pseudomonadota bacterium]MBS0573054.1 tetratricopeptide repeat protein [Pseudomonadota bacterium]